MMKKVEDNRKKIQLSTRTESEPEPEREPTTSESGEDPEEDQMSTTSKNYFRWLKENFTLMTTNYDKFCNEWQLNCKAIAVTSVIMMGVGLATMITAIILTVNFHEGRTPFCTRAPADREASIKDSGFTRPGSGVTVLCLHCAN